MKIIRHKDGKKLAKGYVNGTFGTTPLFNYIAGTDDGAECLYGKYRHYYSWDWTMTKNKWGLHDGVFRGEWMFRLYVFTAIEGNDKYDFILLADPDKAEKGSCVEFFISKTPPSSKFSGNLFKYLHKQFVKQSKK